MMFYHNIKMSIPKFKYMGANPIDFAKKQNNQCVTGGNMCHIDVRPLKENIRRLVLYLIQIKSTEPGQHWFLLSIYLEIIELKMEKIPTIYYFDSAQKLTPKKFGKKYLQKLKN